MRFQEHYTIDEMAKPTEDIKSVDWYHGTSEEYYKKIISDGFLKPSEVVTKKTKSYFSPTPNPFVSFDEIQET